MQKDALKLFEVCTNLLYYYLYLGDLKETQKAKVGLCRTLELYLKLFTLFYNQCHNCNEKSLNNLQKDALKLFEVWTSSYLYLGKTIKK